MEETKLETVEEKESFKITDFDTLDWAFQKLAEHQADKEKIEEYAKSKIEKYETWKDEETKKIDNKMSYLQFLIQEYHSQTLVKDGKKTISTPFGKSKVKTTKAQPDKADEEKLISFAEENLPDFVETEKKLKWGEFKKKLQVMEIEGRQVVIDENGQEVPGATVKPETISYSVEITK